MQNLSTAVSQSIYFSGKKVIILLCIRTYSYDRCLKFFHITTSSVAILQSGLFNMTDATLMMLVTR